MARDFFGVQVDAAAIAQLEAADMGAAAFYALGSECLPTAWDCWGMVLHSATSDDPGIIDVVPGIYRTLGFDRVADLWEEHASFLRTIRFEKVAPNEGDDLDELMPDMDGGYYLMQDRAAFEQGCEERASASVAVFRGAGLPSVDVAAEMSVLFNLEGVSEEAFDVYWARRITETPKFASYAPEWPDDAWIGPIDPFGWLTRRHQAALRAHGFEYSFAFWEREDGDDRGALWIQTDKGPLQLFDSTDALSMRSNFPVRVSSLDGTPLLDLTRDDVPDWLFDVSQNTWARKQRLARFWPKFLR